MSLLNRLFSRGAPPRAFALNTRRLTGTGNYDVAAVGESNYQEELWAGAGGFRPEHVRVNATVVLMLEPENPQDPGAIAVHLEDGAKVAYLSRHRAAEYAAPLQELAATGQVGTCAAVIVGGNTFADGREGLLGIWLDLAEPDEVLLPPHGREYRRWQHGDRTSTGASRAVRTAAGEYFGRHYTEYVDDVRALKREGALDAAVTLLRGLIDAVEAEATAEGIGVPPWYYEQLAIVLRKQHDFAGEIAVLERYAALDHAHGATEGKLIERLAKARERLHQSGGA